MKLVTGLIPILATLAVVSAGVAPANADTVVFDVANIDYHLTSVSGNPPLFPGDYYGSGQFTWTYTSGDFANGSGAFTSLSNPFNGSPAGYVTTDTADLGGMSTTLSGGFNIQNLSYDIQVAFNGGLTGPTSTATVNGGSFDLTGNYPGLPFVAGEFVGDITGGAVSPAGSAPPPAPEPSTYLLLGAGVLFVGGLARSRRRLSIA